jgi:hypothetical protein
MPTLARRRSGSIGIGSTSAAVGDLDSDGHADVALGAGLMLYGDGSFNLGRSAFLSAACWSGGDVDGDGFDDLVAGSPDDELVEVYSGSATFLGLRQWYLAAP